MMKNNNEIVIFETEDKAVTLSVPVEQETVWLTQEQMSELFDTARSSIAYHIGNIFKEEELDRNTSVEIFDRSANASRPPKYYNLDVIIKEELDNKVVVAKFATTTLHGAIEGKAQTHMRDFYNLDVIISVGYRVKSKRSAEFRKWANSVLKQYILQGYAVNHNRITQLGEMIKTMKRTQNELDSQQVLNVIQKYSKALELLDSYDHQTMKRPKGKGCSSAVFRNKES